MEKVVQGYFISSYYIVNLRLIEEYPAFSAYGGRGNDGQHQIS